MLAQCLRAALASPRASPLNQGRGFIFAQAWVAELFQLQLASEENMTPDLIIGALVALAVLAVFAAIFFYRQSKAQGVTSSDNQLFGEGLDEQIKEQFKTVLLGQSVIISKEQHNEFVAQSTQLQQYADSLTELKAQLQNLSAENTQLKQQNQEQGLQLSEAQSTNSHLKELNETQKQALEQAQKDKETALEQAKKEKDEALAQAKKDKDEALDKAQKDKEEAVAKSDKTGADNLNANIKRYESTIAELKASNDQLLSELKDAQSKELQTQKDHAKAQIEALSTDRDNLSQKAETLQKELNEKNSKIASLESDLSAQQKLRAADNERFNQAQADLENRLNTLGEKLLKERSESLGKLNSEQMGQIISPLRNELNTFRELISSTQKTNSEQAGQLQNELKHLQDAQVSLTAQADKLSLALLQGNKSQGMWGEHQLERVLELAGLDKNCQYLREVAGENSNNVKGRADVVIPLPDRHAIVIDSKCSLTAYTDLVNAELNSDAAAYADALSRHITSIKNHVDELNKKEYQDFTSFDSPSFVFMFVPVDQALAVALREDPQLYDYAQKKNIALVSPSITVPALRVVSNLWVLADQSEKLKQLAQLADRIYQKSQKVCSDFEGVLKARDSLNNNIDKLNTSLYQGRSNLGQMLNTFSQRAAKLSPQDFNTLELELSTDTGTSESSSLTALPDVKVERKGTKQLTKAKAKTATASDTAASTEAPDPAEAEATEADLPSNS